MNFLRLLALQEKKNILTARVSILLKSCASLACFRACFLLGRTKDLSAPLYIGLIEWLTHNLHCLRLVILCCIWHEHSFLTMPILTRLILPSPMWLYLLTVITYTSRSPLPVRLKNWSGNSGYQKTSGTTKCLPITLLPVFALHLSTVWSGLRAWLAYSEAVRKFRPA